MSFGCGCRTTAALGEAEFEDLRREAIFSCCKWDPQVEDVAVVAPFALVLDASVWAQLARAAEGLAEETLRAEAAAAQRPDCLRELGLPRTLRELLQRNHAPAGPAVRVMRFDFHPTADGWRVSETNTDVPGGYNEASGLGKLMARRHPGLRLAGDPVAEVVAAFCAWKPTGGTVGLVHATAYVDDRQVMTYLGRHLMQAGWRTVLLGPDALERMGTGAAARVGEQHVAIDALFRFFPGEWLPNLGRPRGWEVLVRCPGALLCNPAGALVSQSKRFPLVWDRLATPMPLWRQFLPETIDPRELGAGDGREWVFKSAFGRVGDGVGIAGVTRECDWQGIRRAVRRHPGHWVAQRRFAAVAVEAPGGPVYPCLGVYTVEGRAAGVYGRVGVQPLIDHRAREAAVLIESSSAETDRLFPASERLTL